MKPNEYLKKTLKTLDENYEATCEDCGNKSKMSHAIINHDMESVKIVCHDCFENKYQEFLYPKNGTPERG